MATQLWDLTLLAPIISVDGVGNTTSIGVGSASTIYPPQQWDIQYWDGVTWGTGIGNTNSTSVGAATAENATWYDISGTADTGGSGIGNTLSQAVDSGVTVRNPISVTGVANTLSEAADFAPFIVIAPPSATGFGETISSSYGTVLRSFNSIGQETEGGFDLGQQTTSSVLVRPTARGDFILDGLPLPS
jgi:hypothetical protein